MFSILLIAIGIAVLALGKRLAVLGAAVGALLGVGLLRLFPGSQSVWFELGLPILLAVIGFFGAAVAKGFVNLLILAMGALGGAAIVLAFLNLFNLNFGLLDWGLAIIGAVIGLALVRRFKEMGMIVLAGLIGALLVTRGLGQLLPAFQGALGTLVVIVLTGGSVAFQSGFIARYQAQAKTKAAKAVTDRPPAMAPAPVTDPSPMTPMETPPPAPVGFDTPSTTSL